MEVLLGIVLSLIFEGCAEVAGNRKLTPWIRYPAIALVSAFVLAVLGLVGFAGVVMIASGDSVFSICGGLLLLGLDVFLLLKGIKRLKTEAHRYRKHETEL